MRWQLPLHVHGIGRSDWSIAAATLFFAVALWLPPVALQRPTVSYLVTFDVTQSMDVEDVFRAGKPQPISRLAAARAAMRDLLPQLPCGSRLGWAIFADYRSLPLVLPVEVCSHYDELLASLERIDGGMRWANASNVGKGATWAVRTARTVGETTRVIFFTDGHESPPLRTNESPPLDDISSGEVGGWLIGVGGDMPQRIPKTTRDGLPIGYWTADEVVQRTDLPPGQSREHLSDLREDHLKKVARQVGFGYLRLTTSHTLAEAMLDPALAQLRPTATDMRWAPAALALALLLWRFAPALPRRTSVKRKLTTSKSAAVR